MWYLAKKNGSTQVSGKGGTGKFKFVDKRMKSDMKRVAKSRGKRQRRPGTRVGVDAESKIMSRYRIHVIGLS